MSHLFDGQFTRNNENQIIGKLKPWDTNGLNGHTKYFSYYGVGESFGISYITYKYDYSISDELYEAQKLILNSDGTGDFYRIASGIVSNPLETINLRYIPISETMLRVNFNWP